MALAPRRAHPEQVREEVSQMLATEVAIPASAWSR